MIRMLVFFMLFATVRVTTQEMRGQVWNRNTEVIFPGPTYRPRWAQYLQDNRPTTPAPDPVKANYVKPEDADDDGECDLTVTPPQPGSQCCGVDASTRDRIVGGDPTLIEQHPWLVQIEYYNRNENRYKKLCGGFLISGRYVVSAGHCFAGDVLNVGRPVNVILGDYNTSNEGPDCVKTSTGSTVCTDGAITVPIENYVVHPKYLSQNTSIYNDIALVRLNKIVQYTKFIRPVCLPSSDIAASAPRSLRFHATGWGAVKDRLQPAGGRANFRHQYEYDGVKRHVDVPHVDDVTCGETYKFVNRGHICAGAEKGKDACNGDSGGPLVHESGGVHSAVGMVSTGLRKYACGAEGRPAVYTRVYPYVGWLRNNIKP